MSLEPTKPLAAYELLSNQCPKYYNNKDKKMPKKHVDEYKEKILRICAGERKSTFQIAEALGVSKQYAAYMLRTLKIPIYIYEKEPVKNLTTRFYKSNGEVFLEYDPENPEQENLNEGLKKERVRQILKLCNGKEQNISQLSKLLNKSGSAVRVALQENNVPYINKTLPNNTTVRVYLSDGTKFLSENEI